MNPTLTVLAFLLVLVGYGTKVGLAPMHTWLPDAHSESPAPVSAMLSGALLNAAMLGIVRYLAIAERPPSGALPRLALVALGALSLLVAALFIVRQRGIKRLMAYSSVEHMGVIALGFGFGGPFGVAGALYHMLNHSLEQIADVLWRRQHDAQLTAPRRSAKSVRSRAAFRCRRHCGWPAPWQSPGRRRSGCFSASSSCCAPGFSAPSPGRPV